MFDRTKRMLERRSGHESRQAGGVIIIVVLLTTLAIAFSGALLSLSIARARALEESAAFERALLLAEAGLEAAQYELSQGLDPGGDGIGTASFDLSGGSYSVVVTALAPERWELRSTGTFGVASRTVEAVVERTLDTAFPPAAISLVGDIPATQLVFNEDSHLALSGGEHAAFSVTTDAMLDSIGDYFVEDVHSGGLLGFLTGAVTSVFTLLDGTSADLAVAKAPCYPPQLDDLGNLHAGLANGIQNSVIPSAQTVSASQPNHVVLGDEQNPQVFLIDGPFTRGAGQSLSGHGTLLVDELIIEGGATLDWVGNVIVFSEDSRASFELKDAGSSVEIDGNFLILGGDSAADDAEVRILDDTSMNVRGSVLLGTAYDSSGKKARLEVRRNATFTVDGLMTLIGQKFEARFEDDSDFEVNGMLQLGFPGSGSTPDIKAEFLGDLGVYNNPQSVLDAMQTWAKLGTDLSIPEVAALTDGGEWVTRSWRVLPGGGGS